MIKYLYRDVPMREYKQTKKKRVVIPVSEYTHVFPIKKLK